MTHVPPLLALSLRDAPAVSYREPRDAIARDWWPFLRVALPGVLPILLPNDPELAGGLCRLPGLVGLVLTGGDDVGTCPERDLAEEVSFRVARDRALPVLGVCRGLQFLVHLHGGTLRAGDPAVHRATRHAISPLDGTHRAREVNSFHGVEAVLAEGGELVATALGPDGSLEAFRHRAAPVHGIQWHPEREAVPDLNDLAFVRSLFEHREA